MHEHRNLISALDYLFESRDCKHILKIEEVSNYEGLLFKFTFKRSDGTIDFAVL